MKINKKLILYLGLLIFAVNFFFRLFYISQLKGVSGGDAYNNLFIARDLAELKNPFVAARRLPFYPLLLVPTQFFNVDPILWERVVRPSGYSK